jgi:hypothetical protein
LLDDAEKRFESDRRANRKRLRALAEQQAVAQTLLDVDEKIGNHRFLELRHQLTHSLAPILAWQSLLWFEVAEIDERTVSSPTVRATSRQASEFRARRRPTSSTRARSLTAARSST